jgi:hypothetical protein
MKGQQHIKTGIAKKTIEQLTAQPNVAIPIECTPSLLFQWVGRNLSPLTVFRRDGVTYAIWISE